MVYILLIVSEKINYKIKKVKVKSLSHVRLFATPWTVALQAPLFMGFSRQEYCSVLPFPSPGDLPNPGIKPASFMSPALAGGFFTTNATWEALSILVHWFLKCQCSLLLSSV